MCGILAVVGASDISDERFEAALETMHHRGPDDHGVMADDSTGVRLGHRRLAIVDVSAAGHQPMESGDGRLAVVLNGEIYNHREIRADLEGRGHAFRTRSDTEVLLAAYAEWGVECVRRFRGMWAFALLDRARRRLVVCRDRFGEKPLFWSKVGGGLAFASEPAALTSLLGAASPNWPVVRAFLVEGQAEPFVESFFESVYKLPQGTHATIDLERPELEPPRPVTYFTPLDLLAGAARDVVGAEAAGRDVETAALDAAIDPEDIWQALVGAARLTFESSDVPVGGCLSGGLDSSAVAGALTSQGLGAGAHYFTYGPGADFAGPDETPYAREVAERSKGLWHLATFGRGEYEAVLRGTVRAQQEPFESQSIVAQWVVMREASRNGIKVLLDGQGGDEILGGYPRYIPAAAVDAVLRGDPGHADARALVRHYWSSSIPRLLTAMAANLVRTGDQASARSTGAGGISVAQAGGSRYARARLADLAGGWFPALLRYEDRNAMAHSVETRLPFLDVVSAETCFAAPASTLLAGAALKGALREGAGPWLPESVRARRDKVGFEAPEAALWADEAWGPFLVALARSGAQSVSRAGIDVPRAAPALAGARDAAADPPTRRMLWRLASVALWLEECCR